nr:MAG TPA: hypothetical protein [Caudoviricetes sp.]
MKGAKLSIKIILLINLNILKKSSVVDLSVLYSSGEVATPVRIRIT